MLDRPKTNYFKCFACNHYRWICFLYCVYDEGYRNNGEWALNIKSVIVFGDVEIIDEEKTVEEICRKLSSKFTDDTEYVNKEIKAFLSKTLLLRLVPAHICGKLVNES